MSIRFGTSGWRAVIADEFTFAGVRTVTEAICTHFEGTAHADSPNVVGHDTRFLGERFGVARSGATWHLVDRLAAKRGLPVFETPVGFKYIGELINEDKIILGGEESAGLSIKGHFPEKDGVPACLLAAEAVPARGASVTQQLNALYGQVGRLESARISVRLTPELMASLPEKLKQNARDIGGRPVVETNRTDGVKFIFADGSWLLMCPSGTEPVVRVYAESESATDLEVLLEQGRKHILG